MWWRWIAGMLLVTGLGGCLLSETLDSSYDDMADARKKGGIGNGWIPEWLPASTRAIREVHNVDNNLQLIAFKIEPGQSWPLPDGCRSIAPESLAPMRFSRSWAPSIDELRRAHVFYHCPSAPAGDGWFIAIDAKQASVVMWTAWYE